MSRWSGERADVVVVGAGVIGLALAYELGRRGRRTLLLERDRPGAGATWAAGGMLAPVSEAETDPPALIDFGRDSLRRYPTFVAEVERLAGASCGYQREGTLWVALDRDDAAELAHVRETLVAKGLAVRPLGVDELRAREPHLSGRALVGLLVAEDHQVDPRALVGALERANSRLGVEVRAGSAVQRIERTSHGTLLVSGQQTGGGAVAEEAGTVVVAAGAWGAGEIELPTPPPGIRPVKGQLVRLRGPRLLRCVVRTPHVYLVPRADGELLVGATVEEMGYDLAPTAGATLDLLRRAWQALPGIYDLHLAEVSVGLRAAVDDHLPVIGETDVPGLFLAGAHFRNGVLLAPATAHYLADWIERGRAPEALAPFAPERLAHRAPAGRD
jgi:glycine oxidase